jgi:ATP-binding cassette subfamily B protein
MNESDPGTITITELTEPPQIKLRRLPSLLAGALRLTWTAARRELLLVIGLQALGGLGLAIPLLAGRDLLAAIAGGGGSAELFLHGAVALVLLAAMNLASVVATGRYELLSELLARHAHRRILDVACTVPLERFDTPAFHNRLERATISAEVRPNQLAQGLGGLAQAAMGVTGVAVAVAAIEPLLVPATLLAAVPLLLAGVKSGEILFAMVFRITAAERERNYLLRLLTSRRPAAEVRAFELSPYLRGRWEERTSERITEMRRSVRARLRITLVSRLISAICFGGLFALLFLFARAGRMTVADVGAAAGAVLLLGARLRVAAVGADQLFEAAPFLDDLRAFLNLERRRQVAARAAPIGFQRLTLEDVTFTYPGADRPAVRDISLEIKAGELIALVGANGSGKTTLAKLLSCLYLPTAGRISYDGVEVTEANADGLRGSAAVLFQDFERYLLPVADNIGLGRWEKGDDRAAIAAAATTADADGFLRLLPHGYDTLLGPEFAGGTDLSGGQWQRLALARVFFRDAPFIILDEPTATLDAQAEHELFDRIRTLLADRSVLLISHRFSAVRSADRIYVMADGRVIEHGTHQELMDASGRYAEMFHLQASGYLEPTPDTNIQDARSSSS